VELPDKHPYLLVVFTEGKQASANEAIIPFLSTRMAEAAPRLK
jgi:hypothetical protein